MFNLEMVKYLPELAWENIDVKKVKSYKSDSADYQVKVSYRNNGKLPTALKQAHLVKIVKEDRIVLDFDTAGSKKGKTDYKVIQDTPPARTREGRGGFGGDEPAAPQRTFSKNVPFTQGESSTTSVITVRLYNRSELAGKASLFSTRGGILKGKEFVIK